MIANELPTVVIVQGWDEDSEKSTEEVYDVLYIDKYLTVDGNGNPVEMELVTCHRKGEVIRVAIDDCKILKTRRINYGIIPGTRSNPGGKNNRRRKRDRGGSDNPEGDQNIATASKSDSSGAGSSGQEDGGETR